MQVAVRQDLLDYGTTVGLKALSSHIQDITIDEVKTKLQVPVVGAVSLHIKNIKCLEFTEPRELAKIQISNSSFYASSKALSAKFKYQWKWKSHNLPLKGAGDGTIAFDSGDVAMHFSVVDPSGGPQLHVDAASIAFDDIELEAHGSSLSWLYNALLALFHDQIVARIEERMSSALLHDVPAKLNSYLHALPSTIVIRGLPISAAFRYAIYTRDFILVRAFPIVGVPIAHPAPTTPAPGAPEVARLDADRAQPLRTLGTMREHPEDSSTDADSDTDAVSQSTPAAEEPMATESSQPHQPSAVGYTLQGMAAELSADGVSTARSAARRPTDAGEGAETPAPLRRTGDALAALWGAAWRRWEPLEDAAVLGVLRAGADGEGQKCPDSSSKLNVSDAEMQADSHMATLFMNDAVPQCLLWALHRRQLLHYTVQDGDLPGIRLLTDLFAVLIPGVQVDYPHRSIALAISATSEPKIAFLPGKGAHIAASYETHVFVLPKSDHMHAAHVSGKVPDGSVEVAVLETELSGIVDLQFKRSKVSDLEVKYTVKKSKYKINPWTWEATIRYVVGQAQSSIGIESLWDRFVAHGVASALHAQHALGKYLPGWFQLSVDFRVDLD